MVKRFGYKEVNLFVSRIHDILVNTWDVRDQIVFCFLSEPGIGKTEQIYRFSQWIRDNTEYKDSKVVEVIASQILPNEVSGITMPNNDSKAMEVYDHVRLGRLKDGDILFFDELLQGSPQVLSACLTLIQERRMMSGRKLPDIMIVAAANPTASPSMIPLAIRQRFMFVDVTFNYSDWCNYMEQVHGITPDTKCSNVISIISKEEDKGLWNKLSPRSLTKLLIWYFKSLDKDSCKTFISCIYNSNVCDAVTATYKLNHLAELRKTDEEIVEDIKNSIKEYSYTDGVMLTDEAIINEHLDECKEPQDILDLIANLKDPEGLKNYLDNIELERYNEEVKKED